MGAIRIGTSGWVYPHWRGRFYPRDLPQRAWFAYYARVFDTVEINNTFYRLPSEEAVQQWQAQAPEGFLYAVKASRFLTHVKRLKDVAGPLDRFLERARLLREHLGPVLVQLPASFHRTPENLRRLRAFFDLLPPRLTVVMEYRHASLFHEEVYALMRASRVGLVVVSDPERPTAFVATAPVVYVRFHGPTGARYRGNYPRHQLRTWAARIRVLAEGRTAFVYFNNDWNAYAVRNALALRELLEAA
jgi:uncharacterized protein YecE (DUF72 family)